jgi:hypothetical protein
VSVPAAALAAALAAVLAAATLAAAALAAAAPTAFIVAGLPVALLITIGIVITTIYFLSFIDNFNTTSASLCAHRALRRPYQVFVHGSNCFDRLPPSPQDPATLA